MPLKSFTLNAILREWKAPVYDGLCNAKEWLTEIDKGCDIYGIPISQRITVAIHFMAGEPQVVIDSMRKTKIAEESEVPWTWESFQTDFIAIDKAYKERIPRSDSTDVATLDFLRSQHPYAYAAIGVTLMGVGTVVVVPVLTAGVLGAIGLGSAGVTAGSAFIHSTFHGVATGGLLATLRSMGVTILSRPFRVIAIGLGAIVAAIGGWFSFW